MHKLFIEISILSKGVHLGWMSMLSEEFEDITKEVIRYISKMRLLKGIQAVWIELDLFGQKII
jgi:hypothetical protein